MSTRIRFIGGPGEVSEEHVQTLRVLQQQCFDEIYETPANIANSYWWLLRDSRAPVGFAGLHLYGDTCDIPNSAFLCLSGIVPSHRGKGLQRRMIKVREKKAKELGVERLLTYTSRDNLPSANNLIKCGYLLYEPRWEWAVDNAFYFRKVFTYDDGV